ncbi:trichohyalin-like [Durio zibethinus]|uniref:Trichohyalin-like n=1 Tax=Durio zibethinus TaxID=66656 RepID=A0A6P6BH30_DURZI|nr:trichohyalin-like [Durio zibethinus]
MHGGRVRSDYKVKIMSKLKDAVLSELAASNPSMSISPDLIQLRSQQFFPSTHNLIHPPYSSMIQQAILKLNEEDGSSEEAISRFLEKEYKGLPWAHASFLSHHLKKLCRNGDIVCVNNEQYMLQVDYGDLRDEEGMSHRLNIANRNGKEDQTLVQDNGREVEVIDGWSRVNGDQVEEFEDQYEVERQSAEVNGQNKTCEQRIEGFEEQKEDSQELIKQVLEVSQSFSGQIEMVEEVDEAKGKLAEVAQKQRREKRKQPEKSKQQIKVLKDDIPQPLMEEKKKHVEEQQQQRKIHHGERDSIVVCALPAQQKSQSRTNIYQRAHKLHTDSISASLEFRESEQILLQQSKLCSPQRPAELQVTTSERFTQSEQKPAEFYTRREIQNFKPKVKPSFGMSKKELEKQELQFQKPEKLREFEIKTKEVNFGGVKAAASLSIEVKDSLNVPLDLRQHGREHQKKKQIKVYVRRNVSKAQVKESETSNILPTNPE